MENDGADGEGAKAAAGADGGGADSAGSAGGGSGLAGLAERLRKVGGTLEAGIAGGGLFRVVAEVPLVVKDPVASEILA